MSVVNQMLNDLNKHKLSDNLDFEEDNIHASDVKTKKQWLFILLIVINVSLVGFLLYSNIKKENVLKKTYVSNTEMHNNTIKDVINEPIQKSTEALNRETIKHNTVDNFASPYATRSLQTDKAVITEKKLTTDDALTTNNTPTTDSILTTENTVIAGERRHQLASLSQQELSSEGHKKQVVSAKIYQKVKTTRLNQTNGLTQTNQPNKTTGSVSRHHTDKEKKNTDTTNSVKQLSKYQIIQKAFIEIKSSFETGNNNMQVLQEFIETHPDYHPAKEFYIKSLLSDQKRSQAVDYLFEVVDKHPKNINYKLLLSRLLTEEGKWQQADDVLGEVDVKHSNMNTLMLRAVIYQKLAKHQSAISIYSQLIRKDPSRGAWWMGSAISLEALKKYPQTVEAYKQSLSDKRLNLQQKAFVRNKISQLQRYL